MLLNLDSSLELNSLMNSLFLAANTALLDTADVDGLGFSSGWYTERLPNEKFILSSM